MEQENLGLAPSTKHPKRLAVKNKKRSFSSLYKINQLTQATRVTVFLFYYNFRCLNCKHKTQLLHVEFKTLALFY